MRWNGWTGGAEKRPSGWEKQGRERLDGLRVIPMERADVHPTLVPDPLHLDRMRIVWIWAGRGDEKAERLPSSTSASRGKQL